MAARQSCLPEDPHPAIAEGMAEGADAAARGDRRVRQDDVEVVQGQLGEQLLVAALVDDHPDRFADAQGRVEQLPDHQLGDGVEDADVEAQRLARGAPAHRFQELAADGEDLVGVAVDHPSYVGGNEPAAYAGEELVSEGLFERVNLGAQRRVRQPEGPSGGDQAALANHDPEVEQVMVVEPLHGANVTTGYRFRSSFVKDDTGLHGYPLFARGEAMRIEVKARHIQRSATLEAHAERRISFALGRFGS